MEDACRSKLIYAQWGGGTVTLSPPHLYGEGQKSLSSVWSSIIRVLIYSPHLFNLPRRCQQLQSLSMAWILGGYTNDPRGSQCACLDLNNLLSWHRMGRRISSLICCCLFFITSVSTAFTTSFWLFLLLRFIVAGSGQGMFLVNYILGRIPTSKNLFFFSGF